MTKIGFDDQQGVKIEAKMENMANWTEYRSGPQ